MNQELLSGDREVLDAIRKRRAMTVADLAKQLGVTGTAVRQRLNRLLAQDCIRRESCRSGRGRPTHRYLLTAKGRRSAGANFSDLAMALWQEFRSIRDPGVRSGLIGRVSRRLASIYSGKVPAGSLNEKMDSLVELMAERQIPFEVDRGAELPVLHAMACPYPELAELDRGVCAMEREFVSEVLGEEVRLGQCRLDGDQCCSFELGPRRARGGGPSMAAPSNEGA
ncbi:MAG: MarR family transcriptional regulator [Planctomycetes bacterium]|nr:MarR family transcriptional regulator [Planctomycetota bacterium]